MRSGVELAALLTVSQTMISKAIGLDRKTLNVLDFGAKGDGVTVNTRAFQRAIEAASLTGGGVVEIPAGRFVSGTILLKSGVTVKLAPGATILGSTNPDDYVLVDSFTDAIGAVRGYALIAAVDASEVALIGEGTIDGRGKELQAGAQTPAAKPFLVRWVRCQNVRVSGLTLINSSAWTMHCFECSDVVYQNLKINSFGLENNDGLDIDSSSQVTVTGCFIESQDDGICLKSTSVKPCGNVRVTECTVRTYHGALKIGTESMGDIHDILFSNCHVLDAREGAVKFCSEDGANLRNIEVSNITVEMADTPIFLRLGSRLRAYRKGDPVLPVGSMNGLVFNNITVLNATRVGILISGVPGHRISNVTLENIAINLKGEINEASEGEVQLPEQEPKYPEVWMFGPLIPASAIYVRHAAGITVKELKIRVELPDERPAVVCDDVNQMDLQGLQLIGGQHFQDVLRLSNCRDVQVNRVSTALPGDVFARVSKMSADEVHLKDLDIPRIPRLLETTGAK